jgi:Na+/H+ antiporter NhaD/arsenite permease-like protein
LQRAHGGPPLIYADLLGTNIGPNITLSGSLAMVLAATLTLWLPTLAVR